MAPYTTFKSSLQNANNDTSLTTNQQNFTITGLSESYWLLQSNLSSNLSKSMGDILNESCKLFYP